ncbi:MAG TPA: DUF2059 domain-containing protein [Anaeromyxobacteraceae bacterium]|nr:DUF2059 domain-containing protein [Anaeromyxobacteraceae bacterium]
MKPLAATISCIALLWGTSALPGEPGQTGGTAAVELTRLVMPRENWNRTLEGITAQTAQFAEGVAKEQGTTLPADYASGLTALVAAMFSYEEVLDLAAGVYAKHYSAAELRELLAFYRTPVGQKTIRLTPEILQDVNGQVLAMVQQRIPALMERVKARVAKGAPGQAESAPAADTGKPARQ